MRKRNKLALWLSSMCAIALFMGLVACAPQADNSADQNKGADEPKEEPKQVETPEPDKFGVVTAEMWKDIYPNEYATYEENAANSPDSGKHNYLELYPALNTMYKGYAFALGYDEASSHLYSLESVKNSPRTIEKEQLANCISCKTPQFTNMVNTEGEQVYTEKFNDLINEFTEPISCANCHANDPQSLTVGNQFFVKSMGGDTKNVPMEAQVCGQCHNEYYFDPDTKATSNPYTGTDAMTPDAILAYYDEMGFKDWEHPDTGAAMIKVQHPEFETIYGGKQTQMAKNGYSCSDCHMGTTTSDDGTEFVSHEWKSPLENQELLDGDCKNCHADLKKQVADWQAEEEERVTAISEKIEDMINKIAEQKDSLPEDQLAELQKLHRTAQFYWDFVMVENSEGAHNPELTFETLDKAEAAVDEALGML
ncbi:ammonia-forming cytochrome c nitrite reductase subunit c552 [Raoultibacter timonensis]|uniref:nitrite reductase (cytochrome; ammonia-forming) n=1 Tax=Raoultibacter timonensis TaxID=1907662 RepID=A0ABN6MJK4_9ACTN|nr:ammonia-forming cytochrome c nitrite reductase subunit c552 [Raoultibacter timonensis]BDE97433.1 cytochrome C nitrite reductase [Raoultibacter timonensis]BDF52036.1 cytochrome C nitrite reductase [Raoultibacter timonensis]